MNMAKIGDPFGPCIASMVSNFLAIAIMAGVPFNPVSAQQQVSPPTCTVSMTPAVVAPGQQYTMTWSSANATGIMSDFKFNGRSGGSNPIPLNGSTKAFHDDVGTYTITLTPTGPGGTGRECSATVRVSR
jgi:hypothetical protein